MREAVAGIAVFHGGDSQICFLLRVSQGYGVFRSISSMSVPSGSSTKAINDPVSLNLNGSSVIVTFSFRIVLIVWFMSSNFEGKMVKHAVFVVWLNERFLVPVES